MLKSLLRRTLWIALLTMGAAGLAAPHKVRVSDPGLAKALVARGGRLIADYGAFQLIETDEVPAGGPDADRAEIADQLNVIELNARPLDTRRTEVQSRRAAAGVFQGKRLRLIQFAGPVKPEWLDALARHGVQIVSYIPQNAYLVYGDAPAVARMQSWTRTAGEVQWEGEYADEFKINPRARPGGAKGNPQPPGTDLFAIQLVADDEANAATLALIDQLKLEPIKSQSRVLQYLNVIVRLSPQQLDLIAARPEVVSIQPQVESRKYDERQDQIVAGNLSSGSPTGPGYLGWLAGQGFSQAQFDASGFVVDVTDSGIDNGSTSPGHFGLYRLGDPGQPARVVYNRLEGTPNIGSTLQGCDGHGTINSHIIAGYNALTNAFPHADSAGFRYGLGVCPFVKVGSSVVFDPDTFTSPNFANLQSEAYQDGARISANSWGADVSGAYTVNSQAYDALVRDAQPGGSTFDTAGNQQMVIVFAAGNAGPAAASVGSPGSGKNVITIGASENVRSLSLTNGGNTSTGDSGCPDDADTRANNANDMANFSSRGPCADGRMKPDLVAPGTHITGGVAQAGGPTTNGLGVSIACFDGTGVCGLSGSGGAGNPNNYFPLSQQFYTISSGTSHSTPAAAGACALLRQFFINHSNSPPSPAMTKAFLINSSRYINGVGANDTLWSPNQGMGEVNLGLAFDGTTRLLDDQESTNKFTATGQTRTFTGTVSDPSKPFRVTLGWTDAPGSTAGNAFNNDLDLTVSIGGYVYKGNVFNGAVSTTGGTADAKNNVESVFLPAGISGNFVVTVSAANINSDGVPNDGDSEDQDFALVVYNGTPATVPVIAASSYAVSAESCNPTNGAVDPGETVTVEFAMQNIGSADTTNLTVALLATNGVFSPSGSQNYGALIAGGGAVTQAFSFTALGTCGGVISPIFQLLDGTNTLGTAAFAIQLGQITPVSTENFDGVSVPNLPAGWSSARSGPGSQHWKTSNAAADTSPNSVFVPDLATAPGTSTLTGPAIVPPPGPGQLVFRHFFDLESVGTTAFDAGVLEVKTNTGGAFMDILAAGGSFVSGGYNTTVSTAYSSTLAGRPAWSGDSGGFITTVVNLPAAAPGQTNQFRWRFATDDGNYATFTGWFVDTVSVSANTCCTSPLSDVAIGKSVSAPIVNVGNNVTFTMNVTNLGPTLSSNVVVADALPAGLNFVSASSTQGSPTNYSGTVVCTVGSMTNGARVTITIQAAAMTAGPKTNTATVSAATLDPVNANNSASAAFGVNSVPTISTITNMTILEDTVAGPLPFVIGDAETPASSLVPAAASSNTNLVPLSKIAFGGSNSNRTVTITPLTNQNGTATISIFISDGNAVATNSFLLAVTQVNDAPVLAPISDFTIDEGQLLIFTNIAFNAEAPAQSLTFSLSNAPAGAAVNSTNGVFTWSPSETQGPGSNWITVIVIDNGAPPLSDQKSFAVTVLESNRPPVLTGISNRIIYVGATLVISNSAVDPDIPTNWVTFDLVTNTLAGAMIDPYTGVFTWTPDSSYLDTTNGIAVSVTDSGWPPLSDVKAFVVRVVSPPLIQSITLSNDVVTLTWTAISGQNYRVQYKDDLMDADWIDLTPDVTASGPTASKDETISGTRRFYRVMVVP